MNAFLFTGLDELPAQAGAIEAQSRDSALLLHAPGPAHRQWYEGLCLFHARATEAERARVRQAISNKKGIITTLLGFLHESIEAFRQSGETRHLMIALASAAIRGEGPDFRDFHLALAELWVAFESAGLDPRGAFDAMGGGIPGGFEHYAVLKSWRNQ